MGLFSQQITCPKCHLPGAVKKFFFIVSCPNVRCENYDSALAESLHLKSQKIPSVKKATEFDPGLYQGKELCRIRYENHLGDKTEFFGLVETMRVTPKKISVKVAPDFKRICLGRKRVANFDEIAALASSDHSTLLKLSRGEKQILAYHNKRGSTSERHRELLAKYPDLKDYTGRRTT